MTRGEPFSRLRRQLTLLYMGITALLIIMVGISLIIWLNRQFTQTADMALYLRMVRELEERDLPIPTGLMSYYQLISDDDDRSYDVAIDVLSPYLPSETPVYVATAGSDPGNASVYAIAVNEDGLAIRDKQGIPPISLHYPGLLATVQNGTNFDIRTIDDGKGNLFRVLSYHTQQYPVHYLQIGRSLKEYQLLQQQIVWGTFIIGGAALGLVALVAWGLSGYLVQPTAQAYEQQKRFIAHASHELRTPLSIMRSAAQLAKYDHPDQPLLDDIINETHHMAHTIDHLLTLARSEQRVAPVAMYDLGAYVRTHIGSLIHSQSSHVCTLDVPTTPIWSSSDPSYVEHIMRILVENAFHHTPPGSHITIAVTQQHHQVRISVCDDGPGIPSAQQAHIFDAFTAYDRGTQHHGSGLGLSIAQAFAQAIDAELSVQTHQPQGACFVVLLKKEKNSLL